MGSESLNYTSFTTVGRNPETDLPYNAPCTDCVEDLAARTQLTRSFKGTGKKAGLVYSQSGYSAINMRNAAGRWVPVDARLKPAAPGSYTALDQPTPVAIDLNAGSSIKNSLGEIRFNNRPELFWKTTDGTLQSLGKANFSQYSAGDDGVYITEVWPGIDMEMRALVGGVKTNFILKNRPQQTEGNFIIRDGFGLSNGLRLQLEGAESSVLTANGDEAFHISSCIGYDSQGQRANGVQNFSYEQEGNDLDMVIPLSVLQDSRMVYPYTIDPLVSSSNTLPQASITGSGYSASCVANSCNYNMTVPSPVNATIVDVQFSFVYVATGLCWLSDGNLRFASGGCLTGDYWCTNNAPGTCTGTNLSLFTELGSCMPAPACVSQNVPFQLQFFRCFSNGGCSNTCIGAGSPWTVTLVGQTVQVASATVNGSGSTTICQGSSATLNGVGNYGVPPYTYSWAPGGLTGPSVSVSPSTGTTYALTVTDACSQTSTANVTVNVTPQPAAPTITSNSPVCAGQAISLGTSATGTYGWSGPNAFSSTAQNPSIPSATVASAGTYSLYTVSSGCTSATATQNVVVNPAPAAPSVGGNSPICAGSALNLTATGSGAGTYSWTGPNAFSSTTQNPTINPAAVANGGTYSAVFIASGCTSAVATYNAIVNPTPATPAVSSNSPVCVGSTINLSSTAGTTGTYAWTGPNGFSSAVQNPTIASATSTNSGTYTLYIVESGCSSTAATLTVNVVNPPVTPSFTTNSPVCEGSTITLTGTFYPIVSYVWSGPNGFSASGQTANIPSANAANAGTYSLSLAAAGCTSTATVQTVVVNPAPAAPTVGGNSPVCAGSALNLTASGVGAGTYSWTGPNAFSSTTQNPTINPATTANGGTYSAVFIASGCTSAVATYNVVVNPIPATPTVSSNSPVCVGSTINLSTTATTTGTYAWTGPNGFTSAVQNPTIASAASANSGTYTLYIVESGCSSTAATLTVNVVNPPVTPSFTTNSPVCEGSTITLTGTFYPIVSYVWSGPNGFSATGQTANIPSATAANAGTYSLSLAAAGCTSTATVQTVVVNPAPAAPTVGGNSPVCAGSALNLTAAGIGAGTYSWTGPNAFSSTTQNPSIPSATTANAGTYSAVFIASGCSSAVATYNVVINPIPATPTASSNSPVCVGDNLSLNTPTVTGATYAWTGPSFTSATQNPSITSATATQSGTYSVTITVSGCTSLAGTASVSVVPPPVTPVITSNSPVCEGGTLQLGTASTGVVYHWSGPGGFTSAIQNPSVAGLTAAQAGTYSLFVTAGNCTSPTATANIQIANAPQVTYTGPTQICGSDATLTASATVATPATIASVTWYAPGVIGTGTSINNSFTQTLPANVNGFVVVISGDNCVDSTAFSVQLLDVPVAQFSTQDACDGQSILLHEEHGWQGSSTATPTFDWQYNGSTFSTSADPQHDFGAPGIYTVTLTVTNPTLATCSNSATQQVTVLPLPTLDFTYAAECIQDVTFAGTASPDSLVSTYAWNYDDGGTGTGVNSTHAFAQTGLYDVVFTVTTAQGCTTAISKPVQIDQASSALPKIPNIITPNDDQVNDVIDVDGLLGNCGDYEFKIFSRWGNVVYIQKMGGAPFAGKSDSGTWLTPGVYFYVLLFNDSKDSGSITVIR